MNTEAADYIFKILVVGYSKSGKSSITRRFLTNKFTSAYASTVGMDINMQLKHIRDIPIQLTVWDTGSDLAYNSLMPLYYKGSLGAVVAFDVTNRESFEQVEIWVREIEKYCSHIHLAIAANKIDLTDERVVTSDEIIALHSKIQTYWRKPVVLMETSAKDNTNINELCTQLIEHILIEVENEEKYY